MAMKEFKPPHIHEVEAYSDIPTTHTIGEVVDFGPREPGIKYGHTRIGRIVEIKDIGGSVDEPIRVAVTHHVVDPETDQVEVSWYPINKDPKEGIEVGKYIKVRSATRYHESGGSLTWYQLAPTEININYSS